MPIWWSEVHPVPYGTSGRYRPEDEAAIWGAAMDALERSGVSVGLLWQPESVGGHTGLWTATADHGGGRETLLHRSLSPWLG